MAMNYCGRCGSANGEAARFCRHCGADLSSQTAASSSSPPPDVEFSSKAPDASTTPEVADQDPKAISQSLRRIRASGPLIIEAIKQHRDRQSIERINEIIEQSIQGPSEARPPDESEAGVAAPAISDAPQGAAPARRDARVTSRLPATRETGSKPSPAISAGQSAAGQNAQAIIRSPAQGASQSIARNARRWLSISKANRSISNSPPARGAGGPSTVLMQASGFQPRSSIGLKVTLSVIALAILLAIPIYFIFRDRLLGQAQSFDGELNLVSPEDQSAQLVKAGESERARGNYAAAIESFHRALELAPNNLDIQFLLAQTYVTAGRIDDAMRSCQQILRISPEHLDARLQLAEIHRARGNWNAAYREYRNIIELNQSSPQAAAALAAIEGQQVVAQMEERAKNALSRRRRSREPIPSLPVAVIREQVPLVSPGLSELGSLKPPATLGGGGIDDRPDPRATAEIHKRLGVRYLNIREFRAAINEFLQALHLTPDDKDLYYYLGSSYHGLGLQAEAYDFYIRVDSGPYVGPAQSGAKQTRKAAEEENKRRIDPKYRSMNGADGNGSNKPKSVMNRILDGLR